jgi:hypothetical protein
MACGGYGGACYLKKMLNIYQCGVFSVLFHLLSFRRAIKLLHNLVIFVGILKQIFQGLFKPKDNAC